MPVHLGSERRNCSGLCILIQVGISAAWAWSHVDGVKDYESDERPSGCRKSLAGILAKLGCLPSHYGRNENSRLSCNKPSDRS